MTANEVSFILSELEEVKGLCVVSLIVSLFVALAFVTGVFAHYARNCDRGNQE